MNTENSEKLNKLALDVLHLSRNTLLVNLRFLDMALSRFEYVPYNESTYFTDGEYLIYNPQHILKSYKNEKDAPVRDYLHIVMHCVFRHMFITPSLNRPLWDLACDIAVENVINELYLKALDTNRAKYQQTQINKIKDKRDVEFSTSLLLSLLLFELNFCYNIKLEKCVLN
jgi:predicted metal-dependent peptidase